MKEDPHNDYFRSGSSEEKEELEQAKRSSRCARTSGLCLCLACALVVFSLLTPFWLVSVKYHVVGKNQAQTKASLSSGGYMVSASSYQFDCGPSTVCIVGSQWNHFRTFNDTLCKQPYYDQIGQYGFCDGGENGTYQVPSDISAMQGFAVASCCFLFVASFTAMCAPVLGGKNMGYSAGVVGFLGSACACVCFSLVTSGAWYKTFSTGGYLPLMTSGVDCGGEACLIVAEDVVFKYGSAFITMVLAFVFSFLSSLSICLTAGKLHLDDVVDDVESYGDYGSGIGGPDDMGSEEPPLAYKYVYEDAPQRS